jgi:hypothetical protein
VKLQAQILPRFLSGEEIIDTAKQLRLGFKAISWLELLRSVHYPVANGTPVLDENGENALVGVNCLRLPARHKDASSIPGYEQPPE